MHNEGFTDKISLKPADSTVGATSEGGMVHLFNSINGYLVQY